MKNRRMKRTVKGMTLIECIVAILVVGIAGTIMCVAGTSTKKFLINSNHLNNKTEAEASVGATRDRTKLEDFANTLGDSVEIDDVTITVGTYCTVDAHRYHTLPASKASDKAVDTGLDSEASLEFYRFD